MSDNSPRGLHIGIILPGLGAGGAEKVTLTLAASLIDRGYRIDLMLLNLSGSYKATIPDGIRLYYQRRRKSDGGLIEYCRERGFEVRRLTVDPLQTVRAWRSLRRHYPGLRIKWRHVRAAVGIARYVREARPQLLFSALPKANDASILARNLTDHRVPCVVSIRNNASMSYSERDKSIARALMPEAEAVVGISRGTAAQATETFGLDARRVHPIYNPIPVAEIRRLAMEEVEHSWFGSGEPPVILTALRETPQKDWTTLITAFGDVRRRVPVRLAILGRLSAAYRAQLMGLAGTLGAEQDVCFLGFDENPYRYMQRASLFVHSSRWEGLANVLIESMACGTPVVSTDAPYGPAETLRGRPVGPPDSGWGCANAMAQAIIRLPGRAIHGSGRRAPAPR